MDGERERERMAATPKLSKAEQRAARRKAKTGENNDPAVVSETGSTLLPNRGEIEPAPVAAVETGAPPQFDEAELTAIGIEFETVINQVIEALDEKNLEKARQIADAIPDDLVSRLDKFTSHPKYAQISSSLNAVIEEINAEFEKLEQAEGKKPAEAEPVADAPAASTAGPETELPSETELLKKDIADRWETQRRQVLHSRGLTEDAINQLIGREKLSAIEKIHQKFTTQSEIAPAIRAEIPPVPATETEIPSMPTPREKKSKIQPNPEPRRIPESKERERTPDVNLSATDLTNILREALESNSQIKKINSLDIDIKGNEVSLSAKLSGGMMVGKIELAGNLTNTAEGLGIKNPQIKAGLLVESLLQSYISKIPSLIKEFAEKKYGKQIERIVIEKDKLAIKFK